MRPPKIEQPSDFKPLGQQQIWDLFPTPFLRGTFAYDHGSIADSCETLLDECREIDPNIKKSYTNYFFHENRIKMKSLPWYTDFANIVKDTYVQFVKDQFGREISHLNRKDIHLFAWVSRYEEGIVHHAHNHVKTTMSGTYYPRVQGADQPIKFYSPSPNVFSHSSPSTTIPSPMPNSSITGSHGSHMEISIQPTEGEVMMWPSYLFHSIDEQNNVEEDYSRIAISFNLHHNEPLDDIDYGDNFSYEVLFNE